MKTFMSALMDSILRGELDTETILGILTDKKIRKQFLANKRKYDFDSIEDKKLDTGEEFWSRNKGLLTLGNKKHRKSDRKSGNIVDLNSENVLLAKKHNIRYSICRGKQG